MNAGILSIIMNLLGVLGIVILLGLIWFVVWRSIETPIKMKDDILKEREEAKKDLLQIQAAKSVEWDKYKQLEEENDKLRKAYFKNKDDLDKVKEELASVTIEKEKLVNINRKLKKSQPQESE